MKKTLLVLILIFSTIFVLSAYSFDVENCEISVKVGRNGVHEINEFYKLNYTTPSHGFYRYIPYDYSDSPIKAMNAKVKNLNCSDKYSSEKDDGYYVMQIGSASKEIKGKKDYIISYDYDLGADLNEGYDQFYFNLIGSDWETTFKKVSFSVFVPASYSETQTWVTYGNYSSAKTLEYSVSETEDGFIISGSVSNLKPKQALTIRVQLPDNWYQDARTYWDHRDIFKVFFPIISFFVIVVAAVVWVLKGRDSTPIITARFDPPQGFSPMIVGYIADSQVDDKDITSMLYYWADQGLLTISEPKKNHFEFTKIQNISDSAPEYEKRLFKGFFKSADRDGKVTLTSLQLSNFFECIQATKVNVTKEFKKDKALYDKKSVRYQGLLYLLSIIPIMFYALSVALYEPLVEFIPFFAIMGLFLIVINSIGFYSLFRKWYLRKSNVIPCLLCALPTVLFAALSTIIFKTGSGVVAFITASLCSFFACITQKRSEYGNRVLEEVLGYREFIDKVSMDELKMMIDKDPEYYYHVLSYAIVLGLEEKWAKKFESLTVANPSWYIGSPGFDALYLARMSSRMSQAVKINAMPAAVKGGGHGSGFNVSGFAGGGFGGGGGHAW